MRALRAAFPAPSMRRGRRTAHASVPYGSLDPLVMRVLAECPIPRLAAVPAAKEVTLSLRRRGSRACSGTLRPASIELDGRTVRAMIGHDQRLVVGDDGVPAIVPRQISLTERLPLAAAITEDQRYDADGAPIFEEHSGKHVAGGRATRSGVGGMRVVLTDLPCGKCGGCALAKRDEWERRCLREEEMATRVDFLTLTYDQEKSFQLLQHCRAEVKRLTENGEKLPYGDFDAYPERVRLALLSAVVAQPVENLVRKICEHVDGRGLSGRARRAAIKTGLDRSVLHFGRAELTKDGKVHVHLLVFYGKQLWKEGEVLPDLPVIDDQGVGFSADYWRYWCAANGEGDRLPREKAAAFAMAAIARRQHDFAVEDAVYAEFGRPKSVGFFVTARTVGYRYRMNVAKSLRYTCKYSEKDGPLGVRPFVSQSFGNEDVILARMARHGIYDIGAEQEKLAFSEYFMRERVNRFWEPMGLPAPERPVLIGRP